MSANDKLEATYGPGRTTPPLEARVAAVLAHNRCRANNPKADHPIWGYLTFSEDQREFLRGQQAQAVAELMPLIAEAQAEAWDEGADLANRIYPLDYDGANPYRADNLDQP